MRNLAIKILMISALAIAAVGCGKDTGSDDEAKNWEDWMGVKVMMEQAGFDTKGIKILMGSPGDVCLYMPDTRGYAHSWIGEKNGKPWIGIAYCDPDDSKNDRFVKEIVLKDHNVPKSITKEDGYGHTVTVGYQYVKVFFLVVDEQYTYIGVKDVYGDSDHSYEENPTVYFHDGKSFCATITDMNLNGTLFGNVGFDHDLLAFDACYSKDGKKLYDMANKTMSRFASMERGGSYLTYALSHEVLLTVGYYKTIPCVEAVLVNLKTGDNPLATRLNIDYEYANKMTSFNLESHNGSVFVYKLSLVDYDGKPKTFTITVDTEANTASIK